MSAIRTIRNMAAAQRRANGSSLPIAGGDPFENGGWIDVFFATNWLLNRRFKFPAKKLILKLDV